MRHDRWRSWLAAVFLAAACASVQAAFPRPEKYVTDGANVLSAPARAAINATLRDLETETTAEVAVVTVPSLDGMTVEDYANRLFKEWGVGKKAAANGVLVLVAPVERKMRIEVGYGLEPILPDGLAGEIIRTEFLPRFRANDYPGGITAGVARVAAVVQAKHVLTARERQAIDEAAHGDRPPALLMLAFFGLFIGIGGFMAGLGIRSKTGFPLLFGGLFGGIPFLMSLVPFFNASPLILGAVALATGALGYAKSDGMTAVGTVSESRRRRRAGQKPIGSPGVEQRSASTWSWGADSGSSSGSGSGGSSGSSGGSFGGGSSGGGGASGSW